MCPQARHLRGPLEISFSVIHLSEYFHYIPLVTKGSFQEKGIQEAELSAMMLAKWTSIRHKLGSSEYYMGKI